jgi:hypothetical protein
VDHIRPEYHNMHMHRAKHKTFLLDISENFVRIMRVNVMHIAIADQTGQFPL